MSRTICFQVFSVSFRLRRYDTGTKRNQEAVFQEKADFYGMNAALLATNASSLTVTTSGNSSAAITVKNAALTANHSEALVIEGKNSILLTNCTVSGNMSSAKGSSSSENVHAVMIYQSMSGDVDVGTSEFSMTSGSLTGKNGDCSTSRTRTAS